MNLFTFLKSFCCDLPYYVDFFVNIINNLILTWLVPKFYIKTGK